MRATLERIASGPPFDLIHLDGLQLAAFEPLLRRAFPRAPVVYNWHNIDSELMLRYSGQPDLAEPRAWYARLTAARIRSLEDRLLAQSWGHLVCSEREKEILRQRQPGCRVEVIENGVDTAHFAARGEGPKSRILFVGSMDYHANIEAAEWFTDHVWPAVRRHFPHLGFTIAGARPTEAIRALARIDGIEVTGTVPDLRPYYESAVAAVVPLWTGSGTRLKILEAMAASTPVVSTSIGAEGLEIDPGRNIAIANEPDQWLPALQTLINSSETARRQAAAALELVRSRYDWESLGARLWETYRAWAAAAAR
jgi:glycosyltransferase involved in cell wall biosynthesis